MKPETFLTRDPKRIALTFNILIKISENFLIFCVHKNFADPFYRVKNFKRHHPPMEYTHYIVEDFVLDESFKNWVLKKDQKDEVFWDQWVHQHPEMRSRVEEAREIILSMQVDEAKVSDEEIKHQFQEVERFFDKQMASNRKVITLKRVTRIAATALILLSIGAGAWYYSQQAGSGSDGITDENEKI